jgi:hypothetical protein
VSDRLVLVASGTAEPDAGRVESDELREREDTESNDQPSGCRIFRSHRARATEAASAGACGERSRRARGPASGSVTWPASCHRRAARTKGCEKPVRSNDTACRFSHRRTNAGVASPQTDRRAVRLDHYHSANAVRCAHPTSEIIISRGDGWRSTNAAVGGSPLNSIIAAGGLALEQK